MITHKSEYSLLIWSLNQILDNCVEGRTQKGLSEPNLLQYENLDWAAFSNLTLYHSVTALVAESLSYQSEEFPEELADAFSVFLTSQRESNEKRTDAFVEVLSALQTAGISTIPFKGPILAETIHQDIGLRSFWDFDFLFSYSQIKKLSEVLKSLEIIGSLPDTPKQVEAYWKYSGQAVYRREKDKLALEPHWSFTSSVLACDLDYEAIWTRSKSQDWHGVRIRVMSAEDEFIMLALHGGKEAWAKLKYIFDLARFLKMNPDLDWSYISSVTDKVGIRRVIHLALEVVIATFDSFRTFEYPFKDRDKVAQGILRKIQHCETTLAPEMYYFNPYFMRIRERNIHKAKYLFRLFLTPRSSHFKIVKIPDSLFFLYTPFKVLYDSLVLPLWKVWKSLTGKTSTKLPA